MPPSQYVPAYMCFILTFSAHAHRPMLRNAAPSNCKQSKERRKQWGCGEVKLDIRKLEFKVKILEISSLGWVGVALLCWSPRLGNTQTHAQFLTGMMLHSDWSVVNPWHHLFLAQPRTLPTHWRKHKHESCGVISNNHHRSDLAREQNSHRKRKQIKQARWHLEVFLFLLPRL